MKSVAVNILLDIIWCLEDLVMMCGVFCVPVTKRKISFVGGMILFLGLCAGNIWIGIENTFYLAAKVFLTPLVLMLWTEGKVIRKLAIYICSVMYLNLPYLCVDLLLYSVIRKPMKVEIYSIYGIVQGVLTILITGLLSYKLRKIIGYKELLIGLHTKYFLIASVCTFAASTIQHSGEEVGNLYGNTGLAFVITGCMIIVSVMFYILGIGIFIIDMFRKKYKIESNLKDEYLKITKDYVKIVRSNARETRKMRHDLQAHLNILKYFIDQGENEKALLYLSEIQAHMVQVIRKMVSINHEIVDAVILEIQSRSEELQIQWEIEGILPNELEIGDFDICTIFSNLLSNSVEACERLQEEKRWIHLEIRQLNHFLVIELKNPVEHPVQMEQLGDITTKKDSKNHGYGIANVRTTVEKNHGEIFFESSDKIFVVKIIFELKT